MKMLSGCLERIAIHVWFSSLLHVFRMLNLLLPATHRGLLRLT